ncbi:MAG: hypothetical protein J7621_22320 [Niastella sp.]|nr:hypothetical protein [Niastella sp.]
MLDLKAITIAALPFAGLDLVEELLAFEGTPTLLHLRDKEHDDVIAFWVDFDSAGNRWLYGKVDKAELFDYLIRRKSLRSLLTTIHSEFLFLADSYKDDKPGSVRMIKARDLPEEYLPTGDSYYIEDEMPAYYVDYLTEYNYIHKLREKSYVVTVEPSSQTHQDTVGAKEAAEVLNGMVSSIEGYVRVKAFNLLKEKYSDVRRINKRINAMRKHFSPRIAEAEFGSFEVWLAIDTLTFNLTEDEIDSKLRSEVIDGYRQDVLDVDFTSDEDARIISNKFNEDERKMIYNPLFKLIESDDFDITISDFAHTLQRTRGKIKLKSSFKDIIMPQPTLEQVEDELKKKNKIVSVFFNLKEGQDVTTLSKKNLLENLLFTENRAEAPFEIKSPIEVDGKTQKIKKPLRCTLSVDDAGNLVLFNSLFGLSADGTDIQVLSDSIKRQFLQLVESLIQLKETDYPKYVQVSRFL